MEKKILRYFLIISLLFTSAVFVVRAATVDKTPPVLKSVSIKNQKAEYSAGDKVYLNLDVTDDVSGIGSIYVELSEVNTGASSSSYIYDIDSNPYIILPSNILNGEYKVIQFSTIDNADNIMSYTNIESFAAFDFADYLNYDISFFVKSKSNDVTPPNLDSLTINKTEFKYGDTLVIKANASDDISGVKSILVSISLDGQDKFWNVELNYDENTKDYVGKLDIPAYDGTYRLKRVELYDNSGNYNYYTGESSNNSDGFDNRYKNTQTFTLNNFTFTVTGSPSLDDVSCDIEKISFKYKKTEAPSIFKLSVKLNDPMQLVGSINVTVGLKNNGKATRAFTGILNKEDNGWFSGYIDINQYVSPGIYYLDNISLYGTHSNPTTDDLLININKNLKYDKVDLFEVTDNQYDLVTSTTDKDIIKKIKEATNDSRIAINCSNSTIIKKEIFSAIKNTDKKIYIESNGIQWVFYGKGISKPKDIDVTTTINYIYNDELNNSIGDYLGNSIVVNFAENGELPGATLIRIKTDYALRDYLGIENLNVYYYNSKKSNKFFSPVANSINMTEDGYLEFFISHNSTFIISNQKVDEQYISDDVSDLSLNDSKTKEVKEKAESIEKSKNILFAAAGCALLIVIGTVVFILFKKRKNNKKM